MTAVTIRSKVDGMPWAIAIPACVFAPIFGAWAGYALAAILAFGIFGTDVDGAFNLFLFAPVGVLIGVGIGLFVGSKLTRWARNREAIR